MTSLLACNAKKEESHASFRFFDLPGEIRNKIYHLLTPSLRVTILDTPKEKRHAHISESGHRKRYGPFTGEVVNKKHQKQALPWSLLFVNKQMSDETTQWLYHRTIFAFNSIKTIDTFLSIAPKLGLKHVRYLVIFRQTYGEPFFAEDRVWKLKHDQKWMRICMRLASELPSFQKLDLTIRICDWPTQLTLTSDWIGPLFALKGEGLRRVKVILHHSHFSSVRLQRFAQKLEDVMTSDRGKYEQKQQNARQEQEAKRRAQQRALAELLPKSQVNKILVIKIDPTKTGGLTSSTASKPVTRKKGLEKYHNINPATEGVCVAGGNLSYY